MRWVIVSFVAWIGIVAAAAQTEPRSPRDLYAERLARLPDILGFDASERRFWRDVERLLLAEPDAADRRPPRPEDLPAVLAHGAAQARAHADRLEALQRALDPLWMSLSDGARRRLLSEIVPPPPSPPAPSAAPARPEPGPAAPGLPGLAGFVQGGGAEVQRRVPRSVGLPEADRMTADIAALASAIREIRTDAGFRGLSWEALPPRWRDGPRTHHAGGAVELLPATIDGRPNAGFAIRLRDVPPSGCILLAVRQVAPGLVGLSIGDRTASAPRRATEAQAECAPQESLMPVTMTWFFTP